MQARKIPPCARPEVVPDQASVDAVLLSLQKIRTKLGDYGLPADDVTELSWMARTAMEDPLPFQWDAAHVERFLGRDRQGPQVVYPQNDSYRSLPFQVMVGRYYLVNPAKDKDQEEQEELSM